MAAVTICSDFGAPETEVWHCLPVCFPWGDGSGCHDLSVLFCLLSLGVALIPASCTESSAPCTAQALCVSGTAPYVCFSLPPRIVRDLIYVLPEWSSGFPHFLHFKSELGNKEFMIWATLAPGLVFADYVEIVLNHWGTQLRALFTLFKNSVCKMYTYVRVDTDFLEVQTLLSPSVIFLILKVRKDEVNE